MPRNEGNEMNFTKQLYPLKTAGLRGYGQIVAMLYSR